jgi:tetratricopeptide (TPR) repeat protein
MRVFSAAVWFVLVFCGAAIGSTQDDCDKGKDWDVQISACTQIIAGHAKGNKAISYNNRGVAYRNKGEYDRAIADYNSAIEIDPKYATAYTNRGNASVGRGEYNRAISDLNRAIAAL